jgi:diguanylate cyclase (GGDEF)-like protein
LNNTTNHDVCDFICNLINQYSIEHLEASFSTAIESLFHEQAGKILERNGAIIPAQIYANALQKNYLESAQLDELHLLCSVFNDVQTHINRSLLDQLTQTKNRMSFDRKMDKIASSKNYLERRRSDVEWCLALIDIDNFKTVNDDFGHLFGDEVLVVLGQKLLSHFRGFDEAFRYGGEEFAIVLHNVNIDQAYKIVDRFRSNFSEVVFPQIGNVTISAGITSFESGRLPITLVDHADKALYFAKEHGRNQVCIYEHLLANGQLDTVQPKSDFEIF